MFDFSHTCYSKFLQSFDFPPKTVLFDASENSQKVSCHLAASYF